MHSIYGKVVDIKNDYIILESDFLSFKIYVSKSEEFILYNVYKVYVFLSINDEKLLLYGFKEELELAIFEDLLSVNGIGPKTALSILNKATTSQIVTSVINKNEEALKNQTGLNPSQFRSQL